MRGVISAGMVAALEQLKLKDTFDAVYGASAGAISGAYFVANQARYGTTIFYDDINNTDFIDATRMLTGQPILSLEFLLDYVCIDRKALAIQRVLNSEVPFFAVTSSLTRNKSVALGNFKDAKDLMEALRASARIPFFAGAPVSHRGELLSDASIYESIPSRSAESNGYTDLVVLLTRRHGERRRKPGLLDRLLVAPHLRRYSASAAAAYMERDKTYSRELDSLYSKLDGEAASSVLIVQIPADGPKLSPFSKSRKKLVSGAKAGFRAVYSALGIDLQDVIEILTPVDLVT